MKIAETDITSFGVQKLQKKTATIISSFKAKKFDFIV